jgi:hypothetical protein
VRSTTLVSTLGPAGVVWDDAALRFGRVCIANAPSAASPAIAVIAKIFLFIVAPSKWLLKTP